MCAGAAGMLSGEPGRGLMFTSKKNVSVLVNQTHKQYEGLEFPCDLITLTLDLA